MAGQQNYSRIAFWTAIGLLLIGGGVLLVTQKHKAPATTHSEPARPIISADQVKLDLIPEPSAGGEATGDFTSPGAVYAYLTFPSDVTGVCQAEGLWFRPDGELQERTELTVEFTEQSSRTVYLWLRFKEESSFSGASTLGADRGEHPHKGLWRFEATCNGHPIAQTTFRVSAG